jgi:carbonic anhydrase
MLVYLLAVMGAMMACGHSGGEVSWGYDGAGAPENWAFLSAEYAACADGKQQSPIDIAGYEEGAAEPLSFSYHGNAEAVRNHGKFVHVEYAPGNTLSLGQRNFELKSAHFHSPSEHRIDGADFAAELHLVHADADGNLAVVGLLFRPGPPSPMAQAILDAAPGAGDTVSAGLAINAGGYVPEQPGYFRYDGSLTTPPCGEPVDWYVMRETMTISREQIDNLLALSSGPNNRPVQPIGSRVITGN